MRGIAVPSLRLAIPSLPPSFLRKISAVADHVSKSSSSFDWSILASPASDSTSRFTTGLVKTERTALYTRQESHVLVKALEKWAEWATLHVFTRSDHVACPISWTAQTSTEYYRSLSLAGRAVVSGESSLIYEGFAL